jgi:hypothetical protein
MPFISLVNAAIEVFDALLWVWWFAIQRCQEAVKITIITMMMGIQVSKRFHNTSYGKALNGMVGNERS